MTAIEEQKGALDPSAELLVELGNQPLKFDGETELCHDDGNAWRAYTESAGRWPL